MTKDISRREAAKAGVAAGLACAWGGDRVLGDAAPSGSNAQASKTGRVGQHYKLGNQYTVIIYYDGEWMGTPTLKSMVGCMRQKGGTEGDEIKWVPAGGVMIDPDDNTALRITATPSKSGNKCQKRGRGLGDLTVTVTNGDTMMTQVVSSTNDVVYD